MFEVVLTWTNAHPIWTHIVLCASSIYLIAKWEKHYNEFTVTPFSFIISIVTWFVKVITFNAPQPIPTPPDWSHWWITMPTIGTFAVLFMIVYYFKLLGTAIVKFHLFKTWLRKFELIHWFMR